MKRRNFIGNIAAAGGLLLSPTIIANSRDSKFSISTVKINPAFKKFTADVVIAGGGLGGCAAAMGALRNGLSVILTEETDWIGGQLTQQGVPPDEHEWIENTGATQLYREFRQAVRKYYRENYPLTEAADSIEFLNPGNADVSDLSHEPKVALAVLEQMFAPFISTRQLVILKEHKVKAAETRYKKVINLSVSSLRFNTEKLLEGSYFVDATELGDLLPLSGTSYVTGSEAKAETGEYHASKEHRPENNQAFTVSFAMDYVKGEDWTINRPEDYEFWKKFRPNLTPSWAGELLELNYSDPKTLMPKELGFNPEIGEMKDRLNLWIYRRIIDDSNFRKGFYKGGTTIVNWPQNDYFLGNIVGAGQQDFDYHFHKGKQLSLSLLYWLQTEAPRPDGGKGWSGLRLRNDVMGTEDGLAKYPYIRESRRIKALFTVLEEHVGKEQRMDITGMNSNEVRAKDFEDSVGIGYYHIDLHPSSGGDNYIDFDSLQFQIPLGSLIPEKMENIFPANKNIGTTHITNGCYRLHPVEWNIGESVGELIPFLINKKVSPQSMYRDKGLINEFQEQIRQNGIETEWPIDK